ncbi:MAG: ABC transporter ATP-binding protein [Phycisphaerales bacterium]|nr:ABC transporter ATP-binding protein [Phycisphaerales bacterium]
MSSSDLAVSVRNLSKRYMLTHQGSRHATLAEHILDRARHPFRRPDTESFWALKDFNFDVHRGEVLGIVGRNGAGKSTLLKILSRITDPTTGTIELFGPVGSLLEIGTGFHPELTGRENIFLNGAILGMRRREILQQFDNIVEFAAVDKFLDTPVKRYSSGMYIRLAFAVAAHLNPEILIIDEVLAVGDVEFQKKCLGKLQEVSNEGRTVLFVSHNMAAVRQLCTSAIHLDHGLLTKHGKTDEVVDHYTTTRPVPPTLRHPNKHGLTLFTLDLLDPTTNIRTHSPIFNHDYMLKAHIHATKELTYASLRLRFFDDSGTKISSIYSPEEGIPPFTMHGDIHFTFHLPRLALFPGRYIISLEIARPNDPMVYLSVEDALLIEVQPAYLNGATWSYEKSHGLVRLANSAQLEFGVHALACSSAKHANP